MGKFFKQANLVHDTVNKLNQMFHSNPTDYTNIQSDAELKKYFEDIYLDNNPEPIEIKDPNVIEKILSAPNRLLSKLVFWDNRMDVWNVDEIDAQTLAEIKDLAAKNPGVKFYIGHSPMVKQMHRAISGRGTIFQKPAILRPFASYIAGLGAASGKVAGGDYYNPASNSVVIRSNVPAVAAHETGHAHDFNNRKYPTLYAFGTSLPITRLIPEARASEYAGENLVRDRESLQQLTPAYGSYVASAAGVDPLLGIAAGHLIKKKVYFGRGKDKENG